MSDPAPRAPAGFIGLGAMGRPMAGRIAASGLPLVAVLDRDQGRAAEGAAETGASPAATPRRSLGGALPWC